MWTESHIPRPPKGRERTRLHLAIGHAAALQSSFRKTKTSEFFDENIRTFKAKHPYFCPKKSDVLLLPDRRLSPPLKKVFENLLHFLHQHPKPPVFTDDFG